MKRPYLYSGHYPALATRLLILLLASVFTLAACSKDDSAESIAKNDTGNNSLLSLVPANTPYLGGNLSPAPDAIIDAYYKRFEPAIAEMQSILSETRAELEANMAELEDDPAQRLLLSLIMELDGKLNRADIESLGLDLSAESVVYGISAFPVFRMGLGDAGVFRTTVQRVIERADVEAPMLEFQGLSYWRITPDQHYDNGNNPKISLYVAVLQDHLAMGVLPTEAEASVLPGFLALEKPTDSVAADTLRDINKRFDYSPYGSGVLDIQKLANEFLDPNSLVGQMLSQAGHDLSAEFNDQCRAELSSIIAHTPRLYAGMVEFSEYVIAQQFVLETESSLAKDLMALVSDIPHANPASGYLAELALGIRVGPLRDFLRNKATAVVEQPYQCEKFAQLNERARQATDQLNQPIPPMINNLLGIRAAISRFTRGLDQPDSAEGLIALHVTQPEMLVGMAQMLLPQLAELNMAPGEPPVQVPSDMLPIPGLILFAAQSKSAIGLSVGEGEQDGLLDFLQQTGKANGTVLSANYDQPSYMELTQQMTRGNDGDQPDDAARRLSETMLDIVKSTTDRTDVRIRFSKDGVVVDSRATYKDL